MQEDTKLEHIAELVNKIRFAMFTTEMMSGELVSRPLTTQRIDAKSSRVLFLAPKDCHACREIAQNPHVNLAYSDPHKNAYVSIVGHATVAYDPAKIAGLWQAANQAWFPDGPKDPNIRLIEVIIQRADYWETTESKITQIFSYAKALLTGEHPKIGEHQEVELNPA